MASVKETRMLHGRAPVSRARRAAAMRALHFCDGAGDGLPQDALRLT
jgi:hypothetical protein